MGTYVNENLLLSPSITEENIMKKMRGFVDPLSLGFLVAAVLAGGATVSDKNDGIDTQAQKVQVEMQQATNEKAMRHTVKQDEEFVFPFE